VKPLAVYYLRDLETFGLKKSSVRREYRMGRLRLGKRLGRAYVLGSWLTEWFAGGELPARARHDQLAKTNGLHKRGQRNGRKHADVNGVHVR
jgi:hypothetical protein